VTNVGTKKLTVNAGTRGFATISADSQTVPFNVTTQPTFPYPTTGAPWAYKRITFQVPPGTDRRSPGPRGRDRAEQRRPREPVRA